MRRTLTSALLLGLSSLAAAIFKDEVDDIDFHYSLVGVPQTETTFFHKPRKDDRASLLYTLSDVGVLGALNPATGDIVWRQHLGDDTTTVGHLRAPEGENWVASAYGPTVQAWNALNGRNVWQMEFSGQVKDLEIMELTEASRKDVLALFDEDGVTVLRRLHGTLGHVVWEFRETNSKDAPIQVSTNIANIHVLSLHGSGSSYNLKVTSLDTATGARVDHWSIGSKGDIHSPDDVMFVGANSAAPIAAWANRDLAKLSVNVLGSKSKQDITLPVGAQSVHVHAPRLTQSLPHFLVHSRTKEGHKAEVYHVDLKSGQASKAYELPLLPGPGAFSTSSEDANVYFTRITEDEVQVFSSESHGVIARWPTKNQGDTSPVHAVTEVVKKAGGKEFAVRSAAVTAGEDWVLIRNGVVDWTRHEGLSGGVAAVWAGIPVAESLARALAEEAHTNPVSAYMHRVKRHISDLKHLPAYIVSLPGRIIDGIVGGDSAHKDGLRRDTFGFSQVIVLVTGRGRVYGLDNGRHGKVMWSTNVWPQQPHQFLSIKGIVSKDEKGIVEIIGSKGERALIEVVSGKVTHVQGEFSSLPVASSAVIEDESAKWLIAIGEDGLPVGDVSAAPLEDCTVVVRDANGVKGVKFAANGKTVGRTDIWQLQTQAGDKIVDVATMPSHNPISSIGRVLGDRKVLYKYLNQNTIVVSVANEATATLTVQLVDSVSGQVLASQVYNGVDSSKTIGCAMAENWYACSFFGDYVLNDGTNRTLKGYQVTVSDLYESAESNDRGALGESANFSSLDPVDTPTGVPLPWVVSQAYVLSQALGTLCVTQTRQGITNRGLLAYMPEGHGIVGLTRHVLDPRRTVDRDPTAAEMEAEGLNRYTPQYEIDPRMVITHERDVVGVREILATPAIVESTTLVVAYGIDVFGTRIAPSGVFDILGRGFNKVSLVGTVVALFAGVMFLAPMVSLTLPLASHCSANRFRCGENRLIQGGRHFCKIDVEYR